MKTCVKCFIKTLNVMQAISKYELTDTIRFVEQQIAFTIESTTKMRTYHFIRTPLGNKSSVCAISLSYEYLSIDPKLVFDITRSELHPLLTDIRQILADIDVGLRNNELTKS